MAQDFSLRHPLVAGHGNFGSPDFGPAAARYTECRLAPLAIDVMLADIDEDTVDFDRQLLGRVPGARGAAGPVPQPAGQRQPGHRGGHGHEHPAPQPGRGHRRRRAPAREPRGDARRPHAVRQGPRLPDRRPHHGPLRASWTPTAPARARSGSVPRPTSSRAPAASATASSSPRCRTRRRSPPRPARSRIWSSRATIEGIADVNDESAGGKTRLVIELKKDAPAPRHPQQPVQAHAAADELRRQHGGAGRRRAPHAQPGADAAGLHRPPDRGHPPPQPVPPRQGAQAGPPRRGPAQGHQRHRRGHRPHPGVRRPGRGPRRPHGRAVRVLDRPGRAHPRHAARPAHPPRPASTSRPSSTSCARRIAELEAILGDETRLRAGHQGRAAGGQGAVRRRAPLRDHLRHRRHRHRRPHRRRRARRHDVAAGLRQDRPGRHVPRPGPGRSRGRRRQAARRRLRHRTSSPRPRTPTCCSSRTAGRVYRLKAHEIPTQGPHRPRHRHRQPAAAAARRAHPGDHRHPRLRDATGTCSSPPARAR